MINSSIYMLLLINYVIWFFRTYMFDARNAESNDCFLRRPWGAAFAPYVPAALLCLDAIEVVGSAGFATLRGGAAELVGVVDSSVPCRGVDDVEGAP